ncbi:MAG: amidase [Cyclobacteriaceae bacterium]
MKRRDFITNGTLAGLVLPSFVFSACESKTFEAGVENNGLSTDKFALNEMSLEDLQKKMEEGDYTSRSIVEMYLKRIQELDRDGIKLNSIIEINPDAASIADERDNERKSGKVRGPLHGMPFLLKDNIDTGDRMMTTAGSLALSGHYAQEDAAIVKQLRDAGAVLIGKTNLSEWANFRSSRSSSGWSSRGGQTKNPYTLDRNPCGSSSGSGAAVAANLCAFAIGTETNGSISCPSSINGIVGLKPTVGLVSRNGIIPISKTQDTAGPMTRTVRDAAIVLGFMAAADDRDKATLERPQGLPDDYTGSLDVNALEGKRIGIEKSFLKVHERVDKLLQDALEQMKGKGATIVEVDFLARLKEVGDNEYKVLQYEFKDGLNRYLAGSNFPVKSLGDVIAYNNAHADSVMPYFAQEILEASEARTGLDSDEYKEAVKKVVTGSRRAIDGMLQEHKLDTLCGPATGPAWCIDLVNGDSFSGYGMGSGAAMAGYPSISVPLGEVHGLPVGLLFIGSSYGEADLLAIAYAYEQASLNRRSPTFRVGIL